MHYLPLMNSFVYTWKLFTNGGLNDKFTKCRKAFYKNTRLFRNLWKVLKSKESRIYFRIDICEDRKPQGAFQNCCIGLVLVYHKVVVTCHWYDIFICYCHIIECWLNWLLLTTLTRMICLQYKWNRTNVYVILFYIYFTTKNFYETFILLHVHHAWLFPMCKCNAQLQTLLVNILD